MYFSHIMRCTGLVLVFASVSCDNNSPTAYTPRSADVLSPQFAAFDDSWSPPINLGPTVNSESFDQTPALSRDELSLYFVSNRPGGLGAADIWVSRRVSRDSPWQPPVNVGAPVNSPFSEQAPALSPDGHLVFFASTRPGGHGMADLYVAFRSDPSDDLDWETAVNLGPEINTELSEVGQSYLQQAEEGPGNLYFGRQGVDGFFDIYYAGVTRSGDTRQAPVFVAALNSAGASEASPTLRNDAREIFFFSPRPGTLGGADLWWSTRRSVHAEWTAPQNAGAPLNTTFTDTHPNLSYDGRTLVFVSNRPGGSGVLDIWMSTRSKAKD